jgi:hypothetical protein
MFFEIKFNLFSIVIGFIISYSATWAYSKWGKKKPIFEVTKDKAGHIDYSGKADPDILEFKFIHVKGELAYKKPKTDMTDTSKIS